MISEYYLQPCRLKSRYSQVLGKGKEREKFQIKFNSVYKHNEYKEIYFKGN